MSANPSLTVGGWVRQVAAPLAVRALGLAVRTQKALYALQSTMTTADTLAAPLRALVDVVGAADGDLAGAVRKASVALAPDH
jgi:hypothetical protein